MNLRIFLKQLATSACLFALLCGSEYATAATPTHVVRLIINYGDGVEKRFNAIEWKKGMTVEDLLKEAKASTHGITFQAKGTASTFFLEKIDDVTNEGAGTNKRNWQYWLNTTYADVGAGSQQLQPDDVVTWKFDTYPPSTK